MIYTQYAFICTAKGNFFFSKYSNIRAADGKNQNYLYRFVQLLFKFFSII